MGSGSPTRKVPKAWATRSPRDEMTLQEISEKFRINKRQLSYHVPTARIIKVNGIRARQ